MSFKLNKLPRAVNSDRVIQPVLDVGTYPARLVQFIDLGIQPQRPYEGKEKPPAHEVQWTYELLDVFMVDKDGNELEDKPRWISESFPVHRLEADLAKSTKRYKALDPNMDFDGDMAQLVGQPCMVTIVHGENKKDKDRPYQNIGNVTTMRAKEVAKAPELKNDPLVFVLDEPDLEAFDKLPDWIKEKIKGNLGYAGSPLQAALKGLKGEASGVDRGNDEEDQEGDNW